MKVQDQTNKLENLASKLYDKIQKHTSNFIEGEPESYVIALNGEFGTGKTYFLKTFVNVVKEKKENNNIVYIDARQYDHIDNPKDALMHSLLQALFPDLTADQNLTLVERIKYKFEKVTNKSNMIKAGSCFVELVLQHFGIPDIPKVLLSIFPDMDKKALLKANQKYSDFSTSILSDEQLKFEQFKKALNNYISTLTKESGGSPVCIVIDELDRTNPKYAIKFLDVLQHTFSTSGICFIIGANYSVLKTTLVNLYGPMNTETYMAKYFRTQIEFETFLGDAGRENLIINLSTLLLRQDYITRNSDLNEAQLNPALAPQRKEILDQNLHIVQTLWLAFGLQPRETKLLILNCREYIYQDGERGQYTIYDFVILYMFLFLFKIKKPVIFYKALEGQLSLDDVCSFLEQETKCKGSLDFTKHFLRIYTQVLAMAVLNSSAPSEEEIKKYHATLKKLYEIASLRFSGLNYEHTFNVVPDASKCEKMLKPDSMRDTLRGQLTKMARSIENYSAKMLIP